VRDFCVAIIHTMNGVLSKILGANDAHPFICNPLVPTCTLFFICDEKVAKELPRQKPPYRVMEALSIQQ